MNSETETPDSSCPTAEASIVPKIENAPASSETTVIVNLLETASAAPSTTSGTVEGDSTGAATGNLSSVSSKYPKINASSCHFFF